VEIIQGELIQASMPFSIIRKLADHPDVTFVRLPVRARLQAPPEGPIGPDSKRVRSEGVPVIGVNAWREAGLDGAGVKVGIIDSEFGLYEQLLGRELPPAERVIARSFIDHGQMYDPRGPEELQVHGTATAEVITDIAPGVTLYLAAFNTDVELKAAISWLTQQKVDVISSSIGIDSGCFNPEGGIFAPSIKRAKEAGIAWTTAAGNEADVHWEGTFTDPDGDRLHNFSGADEGNTLDVVLQEYEYSNGARVATSIIFAVYSWEAPCTNAQDDYELIVYREEGGRLIPLPDFDGSVGQVNDWYWEPGRPIKVLFATEDFPVSQVGRIKRYQIQIRKKRSSAANARLDVMFYSCQGGCTRIEHTETSGSVGVEEPSISPHVITVGAIHHSTSCARTLCPDGRLLFYSSRGPTKDGRVKPDIAAPSHVSTRVYGRWTGDGENDNFGFTGTSAATPHVAGAIALAVQALRAQLGRDPTPDEVQQFLEGRAEDVGVPGKDNAYGAGILTLGQPPADAAPPKAPSDLKAEAQGPHEISLTWQDNSDNEKGFQVLRDGQEIATLPPDTEQYLDTQGLEPDTRYCYRVVAFNDAGDSEPSNETCATTLAENRPPSADAGPDRTVFVGETVQLDGTGSSDPDGDPLTFRWAFVAKPQSSAAKLSDPTSPTPTFIADFPGEYVLKLTVDDGRDGTASDTVTITAIPALSSPPGELLALAFTKLEFLQPEGWRRGLRDGCVIYTNISVEPSPIRVTLVDGSVREYSIPAGREVIVCGNVVHIDTRLDKG
jgi:subtilisin family serine protease